MSSHYAWIFSSEEEAKKCVTDYVGHPFISVGMPYQMANGQWCVGVTQFKID